MLESQPAAFHENDVMEIVRDTAGNLAEDVKLVDEFVHPTSGRRSLCYRIVYRSLERTLTNEEVNNIHGEVVARLASELDVELR
jgi:phenylalanyl-tRNA synthetase alpha chain